MAFSLGVDIGGTKIAAAVIDENGNSSSRTELPSITIDDEAMFRQVIRCLEETISKSRLAIHDFAGIGIGVAGKVDHENGIALIQNNLPWTNFPLVRRIKEHFPVGKVIIDNDVYMATYGEWILHGKDLAETFVYLTISTGISCCTIHNGDVVRGAGFAGEVGFLPVKNQDLPNEFQRLETVASGPGIEKLAKQRMDCENAGKVTPAQVIESYKKGEPNATAVMNEAFSSYAKCIYTISCLLDPDKLVLGGGVMYHHPDLLEPIQEELKAYLVPGQKNLLHRMYVSRVQGGAGLVGAGLRVHDS